MSSTAEPVTTEPTLGSKLVAEATGTFMLVFTIVGAGLFGSYFKHDAAASAPGIVALTVALALGISVIVGAYAFGPISGGHFNPAVTLGLAAAGRFEWRLTLPYIIAQVVGGLIATSVGLLIGGSFGPNGWNDAAQGGGFASNGWGELSPGGFGMVAAMVIEVIVTAFFLFVILGVTHPTRGTKFAGLAIGLTLTMLLLIAIPVDNASINPARSIATAVYGGGLALSQLWVFIVFPIIGGLLAGFAYRALFDNVKR